MKGKHIKGTVVTGRLISLFPNENQSFPVNDILRDRENNNKKSPNIHIKFNQFNLWVKTFNKGTKLK